MVIHDDINEKEAFGKMTNGDYIRSLVNEELAVMLGIIIDEFIKSALADPTYPYTLDEQIQAARKWLNEPVSHDGKMIKEICARMKE